MKYLAWICLIALATNVKGQTKQTAHIQQSWMGFVNQTRLSDRWGLWFDLHLRTQEDFVNDLSTFIVRPGITYFASDRLRFTAGYAYVNFFPADDHPGTSVPEHRPWQQVLWQTPGKRSRLINAIRLEQRYRRKLESGDELSDSYSFNYRVRYNTMLLLPLGRNVFTPKSLSASLNNELHVNFGKQVVLNYFDQNRLFLGFAYHVNEKNYLQFGYMNLFQQLAAGNRYRMFHVARVFYFQNLDLRKTKK